MSSCKEKSIILATIWVLRKFPPQYQHRKLYLMTRDVQQMFCFSHYLETSLESPLHIVGSFYYAKFPYCPSNALQFQLSFVTFPPSIPSIFHSLSHMILPFSSPPDIPWLRSTQEISSISPTMEIHVPPLVTSSVPILSLSMDYKWLSFIQQLISGYQQKTELQMGTGNQIAQSRKRKTYQAPEIGSV